MNTITGTTILIDVLKTKSYVVANYLVKDEQDKEIPIYFPVITTNKGKLVSPIIEKTLMKVYKTQDGDIEITMPKVVQSEFGELKDVKIVLGPNKFHFFETASCCGAGLEGYENIIVKILSEYLSYLQTKTKIYNYYYYNYTLPIIEQYKNTKEYKEIIKKQKTTELQIKELQELQKEKEREIKNLKETIKTQKELNEEQEMEIKNLKNKIKKSFDIEKFLSYYYKGIFKDVRAITSYAQLKNAVRMMFKHYNKNNL